MVVISAQACKDELAVQVSPAEEYREGYENTCSQGEIHASNQKVLITSLVRDVADRLPEIRKKAEKVGEMFLDYKILIVENDSKDGTRDLLLKWAMENHEKRVLSIVGSLGKLYYSVKKLFRNLII